MKEPELTTYLAEIILKYSKMQEDRTYSGIRHKQLFEALYN